MKPVVTISLVSALLSLVAILGFSAMTIIAAPSEESFRFKAMIITGIFLVVWLGVAIWAIARLRRKTTPPVSRWVTGVLLLENSIYSLLIIFGILA